MFSRGVLNLATPAFADQQKTYVHQLCADTACNLEDLPEALRGYLTWLPDWSCSHLSQANVTYFSSHGGAVPPGSNPLRRDEVYRLAPVASFFKQMLTDPEAFLCSPGVPKLWPCAWTNFKIGFLPHSPVWWGVQQIPVNAKRWYMCVCAPACATSKVLWGFFIACSFYFACLSEIFSRHTFCPEEMSPYCT